MVCTNRFCLLCWCWCQPAALRSREGCAQPNRPGCVCAGDPESRPAPSRGWAPVRGVAVSGGAAQALEPAARAMGGACSCGTKVAADDQSTKDRLGAPNLPRSAPARVRHSGTDGKVLPCAVRQSGADNPLVHSLSTAQLLEIHEAFSKFGAHPASTADLRAAGYTEGAEAEVLVGSDRSDSCGTRSPQPCAEGRPWTEWWALQPPTRWLASPARRSRRRRAHRSQGVGHCHADHGHGALGPTATGIDKVRRRRRQRQSEP